MSSRSSPGTPARCSGSLRRGRGSGRPSAGNDPTGATHLPPEASGTPRAAVTIPFVSHPQGERIMTRHGLMLAAVFAAGVLTCWFLTADRGNPAVAQEKIAPGVA